MYTCGGWKNPAGSSSCTAYPTLQTVTTTTPPLSEVRNHCAAWQPVGTGAGQERKCGPDKLKIRQDEEATDVYHDFCHELVDRKFIFSDKGEEPHFGEEYTPTPGECAQFAQPNKAGNHENPLSLGVAFDKRGCNKMDPDGDKQWENGVNMTEYGLDRCSATFGLMLFEGCGSLWADCMRFSAVTRDEDHSAPETLWVFDIHFNRRF